MTIYKIKPQDMFHTPAHWAELMDWINRHNHEDRAHLTTAAVMAWNLACRLEGMPVPDGGIDGFDHIEADAA